MKRNNKNGTKGSNSNNRRNRRSNDERRNKDQNTGSQNSETNANDESSGTTSDRETRDTSKTGSKVNDPSWYANSPEMVATVCNLPFSDALGSVVDIYSRGMTTLLDTQCKVSPGLSSVSVDGLASIKLKHTVGFSKDITDPVNVAANALYSHVRVVNNGRKNYDPADLMMYCLAIADVYSMLMWMQRIYGYAFVYSQRNLYIGKELLLQNGINPDDVIANLANLNTFINAFIQKISAFAIPNSLSIFLRRTFTYAGYYLENGDGNIKDQLYQFVPDGFYKFQLDSNNVGSLHWEKWSHGYGNTATVAQLMNYANSLIANITGDEDFALMSGDILKAFEGNIIGLAPISYDYVVMPTYDINVLWQIRNMDIITPKANATYTDVDNNTRAYGDIYQDSKGRILCQDQIDTSNVGNMYAICANKILDSDLPMPSPLDVMESTRLGVAKHAFDGNNNVVVVDTGVDFCVEVNISYAYSYNSGTQKTFASFKENSRFFAYDMNVWQVNNTMALPMELVRHWCAFKYLPTMIIGRISAANNVVTLEQTELLGNVDNYCVYDSEQLSRIHGVALLSLFWVPGIAKLVNFKQS